MNRATQRKTQSGRVLAAPPVPSVTAQGVGNGLYISAFSSAAVAWQIQISGYVAPYGNPPTFSPYLSGSASSGGARQTSFAHRFTHTQPGHTYHYIVKATDAGGQSSYRTGSVRTLNRGLSVTYESIWIINDGDGFLRGKGEIRFDFAVNKCWRSDWYSGIRSLDDGDHYYPNRTQSFAKYNGSTLDLAVRGIEVDTDLWDGFSPLPLFPRGCVDSIEPGRGSNDSFDWARAVKTINLSQSFDHVQSTATETVRFDSPVWDGLKFQVKVRLGFSYYA
jgi:hypothetical protein